MEQGLLILTGIITAAATSIGAVIAYLNWRNRHKVEVRCYANRIALNFPMPGDKSGPFIVVEAINRGQLPTTITQLVCCCYKNLWDKWILRKKQWFIVPILNIGKLPATLKPGEPWMGHINQDENLHQQIGKNEFIYFGINHSMSDKAIMKRCKIDKKTTDEVRKSVENRE